MFDVEQEKLLPENRTDLVHYVITLIHRACSSVNPINWYHQASGVIASAFQFATNTQSPYLYVLCMCHLERASS